MKLTWTFEVGEVYYWAFDNKTLGGHDYVAKILSNSFSGMTLRWDLAGNGLIAPNEVTFEVSDTDFTLYGINYTGWEVIVRIYESTTLKRSWKMMCSQSTSGYGKVKFYCQDFLQDALDGNYPLTPNPKMIYPSSDTDPGDYVVPVILGEAYVPVISVNTGSQRYYPIGLGTVATYTIDEVRSPHDWENSSVWDADDYTFTQTSTSALGYSMQLVQVIIADSDGDGFPDAPGLWKSGDGFLPMLIKMSRSDTVDLLHPDEWIEYFLLDIGVDSGYIDGTSFASSDFHAVDFNGGWWHTDSRENILSSMLTQCDSYINVSDTIELYQFSATEVETFTDLIQDSFRSTKIISTKIDSGYVEWPEEDKPQDVFAGKTIVKASTTTDNPANETFCARFISDSINAQKAAILYFQKKYLQINSVSFSMAWPSISTRATIHPGQVVKINNRIYGGSIKVIITQIDIKKDFKVDFKGVVLSKMDDWTTASASAVSIISEDDNEPFYWVPPAESTENETGLLFNVRIGFSGTTDDDADYDFVGIRLGYLFAGDLFLKIPFVREIEFEANLGAGTMTSETDPPFDVILKVFKNDSEIGFIEFVAGDVNGIFYVDAVTCTSADTLSIICQAVSDGWGILTGNPEIVWGA